MYAVMKKGKAKPGSAEELARRINEGAVPIISGVAGFRAYYVLYAEDDTLTSISVFDDRAAADEATGRSLEWIKQNLGPLLASPPETIAGKVIVAEPG